MTCFSDYRLGRLPKGSSCVEPKQVPARSSYWKSETDSVERCAKYSTDGDSDRSAPDREPAPEGDGDGGNGDIPGDVNGWEAVDFDALPIADHRDHGYAWERWVPPTPSRPEQRKERLLIFTDDDDSKWHVRQHRLDGDGEDIGSTGSTRFPELPDKRSMTRQTKGKVTSFRELDRAVDPVRERMENQPSEQTDWPEIPRFNVHTEVGDLKNVAQLIKRTAPSDPSTYSHGVIGVGSVDLTFRGTDDDNVAMYDVDLLKDGFETTKFNRDSGWDDSKEQQGTASVDTYAVASAIAENNKGDSMWLETGEPTEPNDPVTVRIDQEPVASIWPEEYARDPDVPNLEWETSIQILEAGELDAALQEHTPVARFEVTSGRRFYVSNVEGTGKDEIQASIDFADDEPVTSTYTTDFLRNLTMSVPRPSSTGMKLRYADDFPCQFELRIGPHEIDYLVAPRITTDQPDDVGQSKASVSSPDGPLASASDLPGTAYSTLREAWQGLKIALKDGDRKDAEQFACVINGVRAGHEMEPLEFDSLNGFKCAPSGMSQPADTCSRSGYDLAEPIQSGTQVPEPVAERLDFSGDSVVWTFPKAEGCRCGSQALQLDTLAREQGVNVYGVAAAEPEELKEMGERLSLGYTLISDPKGDLAEHFGVEMDDDGHLQRHLFYVRDGQITDVSRAMTHMSQPGKCPLSNHTILGQSDESNLFDSLDHPGVYVATGKRNSGKSSLAMRIGERFTDDYDIKPVTIGMPVPARDHFPDGWLHVEAISDAPPNSVVVVDEAYAQFHSRDAMSDENKDVGTMVNTSRHCQQTYVFVSQNARYLDVGAVSEADGLLMKEPGTFHMEFERPQIRDLSETAKDAFEQLPADLNSKAYTYVYTDEFQGMVQNGEASFYNDQISRSYSASCEL